MKRGAVFGIGTVLMVVGLGGLGLLRTGVIYPTESVGPVSLTEVKTPEPAPAPESAQAPRAGEAAPASADLGPQEPVPVPQFGGGERRYPMQDRLDQGRSVGKESGMSDVLRHTARKADPASGMEPVVITFRFDPVRDSELYVARVHSGDKIRMNVRRVGMAEGRVYLTYSRNPDSRDGALVKVGTGYPMFRGVGYRPYERGYYVIEMKIYPGKRWNIKPRSFV